jgi:hypothetical protein
MGQGTNLLFNLVALIFLVLTVIMIVMVFGVAAGSMEPPSFLAPAATPIPPTQMVLPTLTPSPVPGAALTPDVPPTPEAGGQ